MFPFFVYIKTKLFVRGLQVARKGINLILRSLRMYDMYPLYWTASKKGIFMRYSHEYKLECIELYRQGIWPETPEEIITTNFRKMVRYWVRIEEKMDQMH